MAAGLFWLFGLLGCYGCFGLLRCFGCFGLFWLTYKGMQEDDMSDNESTRFRPPHNIAQAVAERKVTRKKMHDLKALLQQPQSTQALQRIGRALKDGQDLQIAILQATAAHWNEDNVISLDD